METPPKSIHVPDPFSRDNVSSSLTNEKHSFDYSHSLILSHPLLPSGRGSRLYEEHERLDNALFLCFRVPQRQRQTRRVRIGLFQQKESGNRQAGRFWVIVL
jgi:hypothetical protein